MSREWIKPAIEELDITNTEWSFFFEGNGYFKIVITMPDNTPYDAIDFKHNGKKRHIGGGCASRPTATPQVIDVPVLDEASGFASFGGK